MLPPIHKVSHTPVYICEADTAWDNDRVERDIAAITAARAGGDPCEWPSVDDHPVRRYLLGESRYDAETIQAWLKPGETPARFVLKRLSMLHINEMRRLIGEGNLPGAWTHGLAHGLAEVQGVSGAETLKSPLATDEIERLRSLVGDDLLLAIGRAVWQVSKIDLTDAEKKP